MVVPLDGDNRVTPNAPVTVADDVVVWHGRVAVGRVAKAWGSDDGKAVVYEVDMLAEGDDLAGVRRDGPVNRRPGTALRGLNLGLPKTF